MPCTISASSASWLLATGCGVGLLSSTLLAAQPAAPPAAVPRRACPLTRPAWGFSFDGSNVLSSSWGLDNRMACGGTSANSEVQSKSSGRESQRWRDTELGVAQLQTAMQGSCKASRRGPQLCSSATPANWPSQTDGRAVTWQAKPWFYAGHEGEWIQLYVFSMTGGPSCGRVTAMIAVGTSHLLAVQTVWHAGALEPVRAWSSSSPLSCLSAADAVAAWSRCLCLAGLASPAVLAG